MTSNSDEVPSPGVVPGTSDGFQQVSNYSPQGTTVDDVMEHRRQVRARVAKLEQRAREQQKKPINRA